MSQITAAICIVPNIDITFSQYILFYILHLI